MKRFIKSCVRGQVYYNSVPLIRYHDKAGRGAGGGGRGAGGVSVMVKQRINSEV